MRMATYAQLERLWAEYDAASEREQRKVDAEFAPKLAEAHALYATWTARPEPKDKP